MAIVNDPQASGFALWFTGLSGSGKSTLSAAVLDRLRAVSLNVYGLDGDVLRTGLCRDLGFSDDDRKENLRRAAQVAAILVDANVVCVAAFITPFEQDREAIRASLPSGRFVEVWCDCPLAVCEQRDVKGLYARARRGEIAQFTGISSPFEAAQSADLVVRTDQLSVSEAADQVMELLRARGLLPGA